MFQCYQHRVYEKIMEKLKEIGQSVTGVKKKMANWAKGVALRGNMNLEKGYVEIGAIKITDNNNDNNENNFSILFYKGCT